MATQEGNHPLMHELIDKMKNQMETTKYQGGWHIWLGWKDKMLTVISGRDL